MKMRIDPWITRVVGLLLVSVAMIASAAPSNAQTSGSTNVVWIIRAANDGRPSDSELHFSPFYISPDNKTTDVTINRDKPIEQIDPSGKGTCIEYIFVLRNVNDWASAGFTPGSQLGDKPAYNVAERLTLGSGRPVYLKFQARTLFGNDERARVRFTSGGFASGDLVDGVRPAQTPRPPLTVLNDRWQTITIDMSKKWNGLDRVVNPLQVIVRASDNPGKDEVTVYIKDVRFEVEAPSGRTGN
jgi:hypothetical protein